jgi:hypothetical protein
MPGMKRLHLQLEAPSSGPTHSIPLAYGRTKPKLPQACDSQAPSHASGPGFRRTRSNAGLEQRTPGSGCQPVPVTDLPMAPTRVLSDQALRYSAAEVHWQARAPGRDRDRHRGIMMAP